VKSKVTRREQAEDLGHEWVPYRPTSGHLRQDSPNYSQVSSMIDECKRCGLTWWHRHLACDGEMPSCAEYKMKKALR
jgi:hypothetical protein